MYTIYYAGGHAARLWHGGHRAARDERQRGQAEEAFISLESYMIYILIELIIVIYVIFLIFILYNDAMLFHDIDTKSLLSDECAGCGVATWI